MLSFKNCCLVFIIILGFTGCKLMFSGNPKEVYFRYYNLFENICNFNGSIEFQDEKSNHRVGSYQINYSKRLGCSIANKTENDVIRQIKIDRDSITVIAKDATSKVYEDTEENRINLGIPPGLGINPYYFLNTDLNKSIIKIFSEGYIEVVYKDNKLELKEYIKISKDKIDKIQVFSGDGLLQEIKYNDFKKIARNIYYPMSYVQSIFNKGGAIIKSVKVVYGDVKIKLCK